MKRFKDWVEIFYPRYLMRCVEIKDTVLNFLCLILKKGCPVHPLFKSNNIDYYADELF